MSPRTFAHLVLPLAACTAFDGLSAKATSRRSQPGTSVDDGAASTSEAGAPDAGEARVAYLAQSDAAHACAMALDCPNLAVSIAYSTSVPVDAANFSACMTWLAGPLPPSHEGIVAQRDLLSCVAHATSCDEARACLIYELIAPDDPRCTTPSTTYCIDNTTVLDCVDLYVQHCGVGQYTPGAVCARDTDGIATCAIHEPSGTCTTAAVCTGTYEDFCDGTMRFRHDCATVGVPCTIMKDGGVGCEVDDSTCQTQGPSCDGTLVRVCNPPWVSVYDCASIGGTCSDSGSVARCVRPEDACSPGDPDMNECHGTKLATCVAGERQTIDCASLGLACLPGVPPQTAHCG